MSLIKLSKNRTFETSRYCILKTAILGLPDSGKSYTAMKIAEELLDDNIPITVIDPTGIWYNLKNGINGKKGYEIIVAGGEHADIPLTPLSAERIMRAAMVNKISIIFDLLDIEMAEKAKWIQVLTNILHVLIYENKKYGRRHLFVEEAGEFVPQMLKPQHYAVFSYMERVGRMGRNFSLGMTLINQRAEDISKSMLGLCNITILHLQDGRNSLMNIEKWLEVMRIKNVEEIMASLPQLEKGECWVLQSKEQPVKVQVLPRKTVHPNPEEDEAVELKNSRPADVSKIIALMVQELKKEEEKKLQTVKSSDKEIPTIHLTRVAEIDALIEENDHLKVELDQLNTEIDRLNGLLEQQDMFIAELSNSKSELGDQILEFSTVLVDAVSVHYDDILQLSTGGLLLLNQMKGSKERLVNIAESLKSNYVPVQSNYVKPEQLIHDRTPKQPVQRQLPATTSKIKSADNDQKPLSQEDGKTRMLLAARVYQPTGPISLTRMAIYSGFAKSSGTFGNYISSLRKSGFVEDSGKGHVVITAAGNKQIKDFSDINITAVYLLNMWCEKVGSGGKTNMLKMLYNEYPKWITPEALGKAIGLSHGSGTFGNYTSALRKLGLILKEKGHLRLCDEIKRK